MTNIQTLITETYQYVGQIQDGLKSGKGVLVFNDGSYYIGDFSKDKFHGQSTYTLPDVQMYGSFKNGDFYTGQLVLDGKSNEIYYGDYKKLLKIKSNLYDELQQRQPVEKQINIIDLCDIKSKLNYKDGILVETTNTSFIQVNITPSYIYVGKLVNGQMSGLGTLVFNDGSSIYYGEFVQNRFTGSGTYTNKLGAQMSGKFYDGDFFQGDLNMTTGSKVIKVTNGMWQQHFQNQAELGSQKLQDYYTKKQDKSKVINITDSQRQNITIQFENGFIKQNKSESLNSTNAPQQQLVSVQNNSYKSPQSAKTLQNEERYIQYTNILEQTIKQEAQKTLQENEKKQLNLEQNKLNITKSYSPVSFDYQKQSEFQNKLQQQENEIVELKTQNQKVSDQLKDIIERQTEEINKIKNEAKTAQNELIQKANIIINEQKTEVNKQNEPIDQLQQQLQQQIKTDIQSENVRLSKELFKIQQILLITNDELQEQKQQNTKIYNEMQDKESQIVTLKQDLNRIQIQHHQLKQQNLIQSQSKNIQEINQKESQSQAQLIQHLKSQHKLLENENQQLIMSLQKQKTRHEDNVLVLEEQINMQKESNSMEQEKQRMIQEQQLKEYEYEKQQLIQKYIDKINKQLSDHQQDKQQLQNKHDKEQKDLKQAFEEEKYKLVQSNNQQQNQTRTEFDQKFSDIENQYVDLKQAFKEEKYKQVQEHNQMLNQSQNQFDQKLSDIKNQYENQIFALNHENQSKTQQYELQLLQCKTEQQSIQDKAEQYTIQIQNEAKTWIAGEITRMTIECSNEKLKLTNDFNSQNQILQLQVTKLQEQTLKYREQQEQLIVQQRTLTDKIQELEIIVQQLQYNINQFEDQKAIYLNIILNKELNSDNIKTIVQLLNQQDALNVLLTQTLQKVDPSYCAPKPLEIDQMQEEIQTNKQKLGQQNELYYYETIREEFKVECKRLITEFKFNEKLELQLPEQIEINNNGEGKNQMKLARKNDEEDKKKPTNNTVKIIIDMKDYPEDTGTKLIKIINKQLPTMISAEVQEDLNVMVIVKKENSEETAKAIRKLKIKDKRLICWILESESYLLESVINISVSESKDQSHVYSQSEEENELKQKLQTRILIDLKEFPEETGQKLIKYLKKQIPKMINAQVTEENNVMVIVKQKDTKETAKIIRKLKIEDKRLSCQTLDQNSQVLESVINISVSESEAQVKEGQILIDLKEFPEDTAPKLIKTLKKQFHDIEFDAVQTEDLNVLVTVKQENVEETAKTIRRLKILEKKLTCTIVNKDGKKDEKKKANIK
ncbi:Phosphatidylinositol-4-phosphate_5-kinase [Hexamita inflata]|uniref:Putative n=1 Tax=Hexamita inflata TaxID=28002 RepID=A0ABP1H8M3_9EUKA